ncbi:MAG: glycosyltransferase family 2 protein, partial [Actinomycetota bacterium]|nr:glycosyltransferase family 2 protein [Actinomycetota bacterium]
MSRPLAAAAARAVQRALWVPVAYVAVLTAAGLRRPAPVAPAQGQREVLVLVPAHDEEQLIRETVGSLLAAEYDTSRRRVVVIADNCRDATASAARAAGAEVWERTEPARSGKGPALAWALERLRQEPDWELLVIVDADTRVDGRFLAALNDRVDAGAEVVQAEYGVA